MKKVFVKGKIKPCCEEEAGNLEKQPTNAQGNYSMKCKVCGCNHYKMFAQPGNFGIVGGKLR